MTTPAQTLAAGTAQTVADHIARQRWEDGDASYSLGMTLADLIVFAGIYGLDFDAELRSARETVADAYEAADIAAVAGIALPSPTPDTFRTAAAAAADEMLDALTTHVYCVEDGDLIPRDCAFLIAMQDLRAVAGLAPADIDPSILEA